MAMTTMAMLFLHLSFFTFKVFCFSSHSHADKIVTLPGQPQNIAFQQFSGYVTVDNKKHKSLFYYFAESETDPSSKPLVLWLNGGPGCSSLGVGAFSENGPFRPNGEFLIKNEHSWNKGILYSCHILFHNDMHSLNSSQVNELFFVLQRQTCFIWRHQLELDFLMLKVVLLIQQQ
jgi:hypothetical protein